MYIYVITRAYINIDTDTDTDTRAYINIDTDTVTDTDTRYPEQSCPES